MPDPLGVSRPVNANESIGRVHPSPENQRPQISDSNRINPKTEAERAGQQDLGFQFDRTTVLSRFAQLVQNTPGLSETLERLALNGFFQLSQTGAATAEDNALNALAQAMQMTKGEIAEALKFQQQSQTKFTGVLFDLLRSLASQNKDPDFSGVLARFLKAYDGNRSQGDTMGQVSRNLEEILAGMPASYRAPLQALVDKLNGGMDLQTLMRTEVLPLLQDQTTEMVQDKLGFLQTRVLPALEAEAAPTQSLSNLREDIFYLLKHAGEQPDSALQRRLDILKNAVQAFLDNAPPAAPKDAALMIEANLNLLKGEVVPYLSDYVSGTNDFSRLRDTIALLIHNISRLNTSSAAELDARFTDLVGYCRFNMGLPSDRAEAMRTLLNQALGSAPEADDKFFSALVRYLTEAVQTGGTSATRDLASALVLDQSVFTPYTHLFLPANYNGQFLFTELWLVREQEDGEKPKAGRTERPLRLFLTFDIQNLGCFDAAIVIRGEKCSVDLHCPIKLRAKDDEVRDNVAKIMAANGFSPEDIRVARAAEPRTVRQVFDLPESGRALIHVTV